MVVSQKYNVIDTENGLLDRSIFVDENVYQEELEKIFGRAWLFIGHESLIPNPNDFFLTYMGEDPVILTRDGKGELHAFLNMCRHRGNRIVRADDGNAKNFMCAYHGWTFSNEGKLVSVPGLQEAYYGELDVENLGLVSVAHLDTYAGMVFATWAEDAPTLEDYLGDFRWYLDITFNRREGGTDIVGPDKWIIPNNWKNSADNFIGDGYHASISHRSATIVQRQYRTMAGTPQSQPQLSVYRPGFQVSAGVGHGSGGITVAADDEEYRRNSFQRQEVVDYEMSIRSEMEKRLGFNRARRVRTAHHTVFPNFSYLAGSVMRLWHPRGPLHTEVWAWAYMDRNAPHEIRERMRLSAMTSFGPSGLLEQDDMDNWRGSTEAGRSPIARKYLQALSMGVNHESKHELLPAKIHAKIQGEHPQRNMYLQWEEFMNARSGADIKVHPITAHFEGSATMKS